MDLTRGVRAPQPQIPPLISALVSGGGIHELLHDLRAHDFKLGTDDFTRVERLLLELTARGGIPEDAQTLANYLSPVLCTSAREQQLFRERFAQWIIRTASPIRHRRRRLAHLVVKPKYERSTANATGPWLWGCWQSFR